MKPAYALLPLALLGVSGLYAQAERIPATIDGGPQSLLSGHRPPAGLPLEDLGPTDPARKLPFVSVIFRRTAAQQADLNQLQAAQRNPASPDYRRRLSPAQFADRFGMDGASLGRVRAWLEAQGLTVPDEAVSRTWIAFSGTAAQIDAAFHTALHDYRVNGQVHFAPSKDPSVPAVLQPSILALRGLDDFLGERSRRTPPTQSAPATAVNGGNALAPADLEVIYGIAPLRAAGIDGTGQTIAVVGRSNVDLTDLQAYRTKFGLPLKDPQVMAIADPGVSLNTADQKEASLDLEISGAIAPNAQQIYVYANNIEDAIQYVIDHALAPVLSSSFLNCEGNFSAAREAAIASYGQEADVKGITWVNASGDSGAAACDQQDVSGAVAQNGLWVDAYAAIPEVTGVGGTEFAEASSGSAGVVYWNAANGPDLSSAVGYIPETAWNDTTTAGYLAASGGGVSKAFPKPSWQAGPGVPDDGARDVPDIAMSASWLHDAYSICNAGNCNLVAGGTSAATPLFAGSVALLNQFLLKWNVLRRPGLGNMNPMLYQLAQSGGGAFHDIQTGSNVVPCASGSPDCVAGTLGYPAAPGYDLATGLGSVDLSQLFAAWLTAGSRTLNPTATSVTVTASSDGSTQSVVVTVTAPAGVAGPGGTVTLTGGAIALGSLPLVRGTTSSTATFTVFSAQLPPGTIQITAWYGGSSEYAPSSGSFALLNTSASATKSSLQLSASPYPVERVPTAYGNAWNFTLTLREVNGVAADLTKLIAFKIDGLECLTNTTYCSSNSIQSYFGTTTLPAFGSVSIPFQLAPAPSTYPLPATILSAFPSGSPASAKVSLNPVSAPAALTFELDTPGTTATNPVSTILSIPLLGRPGAANMQLTGVPASVLRNPGASSNCQWSQRLLLRESAGTGVTLKHFTGGGVDQSANIASFWGATRLGANSALMATMCWGGLSAPTLVNYEIDGTDDNGNTVSAAVSSAYLNQPSSPNTLSVAPTNSGLSAPFSLNSAGGALVLAVTASSAIQVWRVSILAPGTSPDWVKVYPLSGTGSADVYVAPASGLSSGTYNATLVFESIDAVPQVFPVPITFTVN